MSLITEAQKKAAQAPTTPAPKPTPQKQVDYARTQELPAFEDGSGSLQLEQQSLLQPEPEPQPAPVEQPVIEGEDPGINLTQYMTPSERVPLPQETSPVAPPVSLWKDANVDLGADSLFSSNIVTTQAPTLFNSGIDANGSAITKDAYTNFDIAGVHLINQQQKEEQQARAAQAQAAVSQRANTPNVPDVDKPWHEQALNGVLGFGKDFLFGTQEGNNASNAGKFDPITSGSYGRHGAGIGGALKYALSVPLGTLVSGAAYLDKKVIEAKNTVRNANNPIVTFNGKQVQWNTLTGEQKQQYGIDETNRNTAWAGAPVIDKRVFNTSFKKRIGDLLTGQYAADDINNANPALQGVLVNKNTGNQVGQQERGKRTDQQLIATGNYAYAKPKDAPALYSSRNRRPGQGWQEDPVGLAWYLGYQIFSPANKIDVVGNAIGDLAGAALKPVFKSVFGSKVAEEATTQVPLPQLPPARDFGLESAPYNAPYKPKPKPASKPKPNTRALAPISRPTIVNSLPVVPTREAPSVVVNIDEVLGEAPLAKVPTTSTLNPPPLRMEASLEAAIAPYKNGSEVNPPRVPMSAVVEGVADLNPAAAPALPLTAPAALAAQVGIGTPGRVIDFEVSALPRNHEDLLRFLQTGTPEQQKLLTGYSGTTWTELQAHLTTRVANNGQLSAVGKLKPEPKLPEQHLIEELTEDVAKDPPGALARLFEDNLYSPSTRPTDVTPPTFDDLVAQSTALASQRTVLDASLQKLERLFDESLDVGRRAVDRLPERLVTPDDIVRSLDVGAKLPDEVASVLPPALKQAVLENDTAAIALARSEGQIDVDAIAEAVNAKLDFTTTKVNRAIVPANVAEDLPQYVYHGTALKGWTQDYNLREKGSRGELGSGLYTTADKMEASYYSRASVGENRSADIAYDELEPRVVELNTSNLQTPLDARAPIKKALVNAIAEETGLPVQDVLKAGRFKAGSKPSYVDYMAAVEKVAARRDSTEQGLQAVNRQVSEALRKQGYDSVYDRQSKWLMLTDNTKLKQTRRYVSKRQPQAQEAATARYNADSTSASAYPDHVTTDANLRDSAYKVLDQARAEVDEALYEVQQQALQQITKQPVEPVVPVSNPVAATIASDPKVKQAVVKQIQELGLSTEPLLLQQVDGGYKVLGNSIVYEAALEANVKKINAVVVEVVGKGKRGHISVDLTKVNNAPLDLPFSTPKTEAEVLNAIKGKTSQTVFPTLMDLGDGKYSVVSKDWVVSAYKELKQAATSKTSPKMGAYVLTEEGGKLKYVQVELGAIKGKKATYESLSKEVVQPKIEPTVEPPTTLVRTPESKIKQMIADGDVSVKPTSVSDDEAQEAATIVKAEIDKRTSAGNGDIDDVQAALDRTTAVEQIRQDNYTWAKTQLDYIVKWHKDATDKVWLKGVEGKSITPELNLAIEKSLSYIANKTLASFTPQELAKAIKKMDGEALRNFINVGKAQETASALPQPTGTDVSLSQAISYFKQELTRTGELTPELLTRVYADTVDSSAYGLTNESSLGLQFIWEAYSGSPTKAFGKKDKQWLDNLVKEFTDYDKSIQEAPVNPHTSVKEAFEDANDICKF